MESDSVVAAVAALAQGVASSVLPVCELVQSLKRARAQTAQHVYAQRKKGRRNRELHPREFSPSRTSSFISGSPNRRRVLVHREHRLPMSTNHQSREIGRAHV